MGDPHLSISHEYFDMKFNKSEQQATWHCQAALAITEVICVEEFPSGVFYTQRI